MKNLSWASIIIAIVVIIDEFAYIGKSDLAWVLIGLAVSIIFLAIPQITRKRE